MDNYNQPRCLSCQHLSSSHLDTGCSILDLDGNFLEFKKCPCKHTTHTLTLYYAEKPYIANSSKKNISYINNIYTQGNMANLAINLVMNMDEENFFEDEKDELIEVFQKTRDTIYKILRKVNGK